MKVVNEGMPSDPARIAALQERGPDGPIVMVNLLEFREHAACPPDHPDANARLTGREARARHAEAVTELLPKFGGRARWAGDVTFPAPGPLAAFRDEVALAAYPDRAALRAPSTSPARQAIAVHGSAGLAGPLKLERTPLAGFGGG